MEREDRKERRDWENPQVFERGQVRPHATLMPFPRREQVLEWERNSSPWCLSLNGRWRFNWSENPERAPDDFYRPDYDLSGWGEITVPSCWQMEGYGHPKFRNTVHSFPSNPPFVPGDYNPVGSYVRTFELPGGFSDGRVFLHFAGVKSASRVWINGREVGYNQGGMEPAEYDITDFLVAGENRIAVRVLRYCDGTYLECQDMWRLSGIYRDVYLMATPEVHIRDFFVRTDLDDGYRDAELRVRADVCNHRPEVVRDYALRLQLHDERRRPVLEKPPVEGLGELAGEGGATVELTRKVSDPRKWSAEHPHLYGLTLELLDGGGEVVEAVGCRVGFRSVEIRDQAIQVNGVPVKLNGVNSHMQHPKTGRMVDRETMRRDLILMKRFNINCVRTSHYPPSVEYLDLADELGVYVVDETGDEAHATEHLSDDPEWREQFLDRMRKMVYRDRNHPSIIMWSAGNESGWGENICAIIEEGKKIDPTRPGWMYGGNLDEDPETNPIDCEDVVGPRYQRPFALKNLFGQVPEEEDPRPSFMDEYLSAAGNSLGGLDEYWELIRGHRRLTGGALWDWVSPGISRDVVTVPDRSPHSIKCHLMGRARLEEGRFGTALSLSGHDEWLEAYRAPELDVTGDALTLSLWIRPEDEDCEAALLTKGSHQYGLRQIGERIEFYIHGRERASVQTPVPGDWVGEWHHLAGILDGGELVLYIDGDPVARSRTGERITSTPFAVNIGRDAEVHGQDHAGRLFRGLVDRVRIFDRVVPVSRLLEDDRRLRSESRLWLDFDRTRREGEFYSLGIGARSYGIVWPDRRIKPGLWQIKKSGQPVAVEALDLAAGRVRVTNHHHFRDLEELDACWEVTRNGQTVQEGPLEMSLPAGEVRVVDLPYEPPAADDAIYHLLIRFSLVADEVWAGRGHEVAWEQFELSRPARRGGIEAGVAEHGGGTPTGFYGGIPSGSCGGTPSEPGGDGGESPRAAGAGGDGKRLKVREDEGTLTVSGDDFTYRFDRRTGRLQSCSYRERALISAGPRFNVWRAPLANEIDIWPLHRTEIGKRREGQGLGLANGWRSIDLHRLTHRLNSFDCRRCGPGEVEIRAETSVHARRYSTGFSVTCDYRISADGLLALRLRSVPAGDMTHWLPKVGLEMRLPPEFRRLSWFGRGPFENYPDRKSGARVGYYECSIDDDYQPYLIPQDYGNRTDVQWAALSQDGGNALYLTGEELLNVSAHRYSPDNLSRACYPFQLEEGAEVTLNIDHRVSGAGGTSISTLNQYRVLPGIHEFKVYLYPCAADVISAEATGWALGDR